MAANKLGPLIAILTVDADVCPGTGHAAPGTPLTRRKWLPFIPPLTCIIGPGEDQGPSIIRLGLRLGVKPFSIVGMRPPLISTLRYHVGCKAFCCPQCKSTFSIAEIDPPNYESKPPCPKCSAKMIRETRMALNAIRMQPGRWHMEQCKEGIGEEQWRYEVDAGHAGHFESCLDLCERVRQYRKILETE